MTRTAGILGLLTIILAGIVRLVLPELTTSVRGLLFLGFGLMLIFIVGARREILFFFLSHRGKYRLNTTVMIFIFILIILLVNFGGLLKRIRVDTTSTGEFTLSPQILNHTASIIP